eukprot:1334374-Prymnesium_polylepis.1
MEAQCKSLRPCGRLLTEHGSQEMKARGKFYDSLLAHMISAPRPRGVHFPTPRRRRRARTMRRPYRRRAAAHDARSHWPSRTRSPAGDLTHRPPLQSINRD